MKVTKEKKSQGKQEASERKHLVETIRDWAGKNRKVFWKYEVSSFYKTYVIRIANLPNPSTDDIRVSSNNRLLNKQEKQQLSDAVREEYARSETLDDFSIDVQLNYENGSVIAEII